MYKKINIFHICVFLSLRLSKKQNFKDKKYGFGGRKKNTKYNTAESAADISDFKGKTHHKKTQKKLLKKNQRIKKKPNKN